MKDVVTKTEGKNTFAYNTQTKEVCIYYDDSEKMDTHSSYKIVIKPLNKTAQNHYLRMNITVYKSMKQNNGLFSPTTYKFEKVGDNQFFIENILRHCLYNIRIINNPPVMFSEFNELSISLEENLAFEHFKPELKEYLADLLWGKNGIKDTVHDMKNAYRAIFNRLSAIRISLKTNYKTNAQQAFRDIFKSLNSKYGKVIDDNLNKQVNSYKNILGIHLVGDSAFVHAKDNSYITKGFSKNTKLPNNLLQNYFIVINSASHEILPLSKKDVLKVISYAQHEAGEKCLKMNPLQALMVMVK